MLAAAAALAVGVPRTLSGAEAGPFETPARVRVLIFARTDCPLAGRYAPELARVAREYASRGVRFWIVYPDASETAAVIETQMRDYNLPGEALRDPHQDLVHRAHATIAPEAAVFDANGALAYHGRIDDRAVALGTWRAEARVHDLEDAIAAVLAGRSPRRAFAQAVGCSLADVE